jgi:hypothetical protein
MISAIELCLNHLDRAELIERVDVLESLLAEAHAVLAERDGHVLLIPTPAPLPPELPPALA